MNPNLTVDASGRNCESGVCEPNPRRSSIRASFIAADNIEQLQMPRLLLAITLMLIFGPPGFARIGETEPQIEKRYGKPISKLTDDGPIRSRAYSSGGFLIVVEFENGVSQMEIFAKPDRSELSETEVTTLLEANKDGFNWLGLPDEAFGGHRSWCSTDKRSRVAYYDENIPNLVISNMDYVDRKTERIRKKERERLKDF